MLNYIWLGLILLAVIIGGCTDHLKEVADKALEMAEFAVMKTALPLVGIMALWLGMMRLAERAGLVALFARAVRPVMCWLFPEVPPDHPAMGSMVLNIAAGTRIPAPPRTRCAPSWRSIRVRFSSFL
jgi:spore maturation protein A